MATWEVLLTIAGLALITLLTRGFFILPERELPMPDWLREGLRYAPVGALVAVIAPELVMSQGQLISTWRDPRLAGALAATLYYLWRRDMLGTIVAGTATMLICRLGLGW
ncbi:AzlD domain-containing protein [Aquabacterium sp. OR-4]|uniref:AzlD domain-containing protein n=1 Tax=Aquabacterium sp. OR-4 TaxID=2978127 RepID=UPI0021B3413F|nr:AzlD domain-containing protein [Aquabacterium sp. OR-4]MDT7837441.1 AzlD domain-containing protein [Aquabacterium sp. OR-4]